MSPQLGAGGSLALADAWTLAAMLRRHESVTAALTAYRSQRRAHTSGGTPSSPGSWCRPSSPTSTPSRGRVTGSSG
jgi:hypothetical protein